VKDGAGWKAVPWDDAIGRLATAVQGASGKLAVITGSGPGTYRDLLEAWARAAGGRVVRYEPFDRTPERAANREVFGVDEVALYDFAKARYIVSFGADFL